jgi:hypothetical protein
MAEHFALGQELNVNLQPDDSFVFHLPFSFRALPDSIPMSALSGKFDSEGPWVCSPQRAQRAQRGFKILK